MTRRDFVRNAALLGVGAGVGSVVTYEVMRDRRPAAPQPIIVRDADSNVQVPVTLGDMLDALDDATGTRAVVTAEWGLRPAVVYLVRKAQLEASSRQRGYNTGQFAIPVPGRPDLGMLAYDGKCTHLGCTVGWAGDLGASKDIADYDGDGVPDGRVLCPCHQAQFDIYDLATHVPATPAPRPLDVLRIRLDPRPGTADRRGDVVLGVERIAQATARAADRQGEGAPFSLAPPDG